MFIIGKKIFFTGFLNGMRIMAGLAKVLIPAILGVKILQYVNIYEYISNVFIPICHIVGLPGTAAIPFLMGLSSSIYGGLGGMLVLNLSPKEMTILGAMIAICHGALVENSIALQAGVNLGFVFFIRLFAAFLTGALLNVFL